MKNSAILTVLAVIGGLAVPSGLGLAQEDILASSGQGAVFGQGPYAPDGLSIASGAAGAYTLRAKPFKIRPRLSVTLMHEDNVYLENRDSKDSWYVTVAPGLMLLLGDERRNYVYLDYAAGHSTFSSLDDEDIDTHTVTLLGRYDTGKSALTAWHRYRDVRDVDTLLGTRVTKEEHVSSVEVSRRISSKTSVGVGGRHEDHDYRPDDYADYVQDEASARLYWHARPKTDLFLYGAYGWVELESRFGGFGDAEYVETGVGLRGQLRPKVEATGKVGWQRRTFDDDRIEDIEHWTAALRLNAALVERINGSLGVWGRITPAVQEPGLSAIEMRVEPGLSRRLFTDRLVGSASLVFGRVEYEGTVRPVVLGPTEDRVLRAYDGREDEFWGFTLGLDWRIARYFSAGVAYSYIENDSSLDDYREDRADIDPASYDAGRWMIRVAFNY